MTEVETQAEKQMGLCVDRALAWHVEGCVKRYGAHGDQPCECEKRAGAAMQGSQAQHPPTFDEQNLAGDVHIRPEDIANYAYPEGRRERYTETGWEKAKALSIAMLDVRDFGAVPDQPAGDE